MNAMWWYIIFFFGVGVPLIVGICLLAGAWQLRRASGGNTLSWAYAVQWPAFAVIAVVVWWRLIHDDFSPAEPAGDDLIGATPVIERRRDEESDELRAYNDYLAELAAGHDRKTWRTSRET